MADVTVLTFILTAALGIISILRDIKKDGTIASKERNDIKADLGILVFRVTRIESHLYKDED